MRLLFSFICCVSHVVSCNVPAVYSDDPVTTVYFSHFVDKHCVLRVATPFDCRRV